MGVGRLAYADVHARGQSSTGDAIQCDACSRSSSDGRGDSYERALHLHYLHRAPACAWRPSCTPEAGRSVREKRKTTIIMNANSNSEKARRLIPFGLKRILPWCRMDRK